ncbi:hypothetical protein CEE39_05685 [bacterium (candidate division B38) B3_B38]|nr:MAG: hypothetical protein CEE39_05685 [bacterium (candidate division B38) B3_B38]
MWEFYRAWKERKRYQAEQYRLASRTLREALDIEDDDREGYLLLGQEQKEFTESEQETMQRQAYHFWKSNPHGRGVIRVLEKFVLGRGMKFNAQDENKMVQQWWDEFARDNSLQRSQKEIFLHTLRDGECFIRYFVDKETGRTRIRFIDPQEVYDPENRHSQGIETDPDDVITPINYYRSRDGKLKEVIPAEEIQHIKILVDSNVKRGLSFLYVIMPLLKKYEQWLNDRIVLNKIRSAVAIIRRVSGAPAQVSDIVKQHSANSSGRQRALQPGTIITVSEGVEYQMLSPNLQAQDVQYDGRNILLAITAATGLAEYMVSGDASNANYSSTMISESPSVREFEDWQNFFEEEFKIMFRKVVQAGIEYGLIPAESTRTILVSNEQGEMVEKEMKVPTNTECEIVFPPLVHRNLKEESEAMLIHQKMGIVSHKTLAGKFGYDYEEELKKMQSEAHQPDEAEPEVEEEDSD